MTSSERLCRMMIGVVVLTLAGCGGGAGAVRSAPMPEGGSFHGAWQSPQYGNMHLCVSEGHIHGDYQKNEREGTIVGTIDGNLARFEWREEREFVPGRPMVNSGHGYFQLAIGDDGDTYFTGSWGNDDDDSGAGPWNGVKLRNRTPDRCSGVADNNESEEQDEVSWDDE